MSDDANTQNGAHAGSRAESHRSELNRRPLDYESSALPLSYCGAICSMCMPWRGLEPRRLAAPPPQDGVSTNFTTRAFPYSINSRRQHSEFSNAIEDACVARDPAAGPPSPRADVHGSDGARTRDLSSDSRVL